MINYESILSSYDDKLTLMQWLKKVEAALTASVLTAVNVTQNGDVVTLSFDFEDGTKIETPAIRVNQQITGAQVVNGELVFTLSNGQTINAGNLLDGNPLIIPAVNVNFNGNATIEGFLTAEAGVSTPSLTCDGEQINAQKPVVELMSGYSFLQNINPTSLAVDFKYAGAVKNGNKLTFSEFIEITPSSNVGINSACYIGTFRIPISMFDRLVSYEQGSFSMVLDYKQVQLADSSLNISSGYMRAYALKSSPRDISMLFYPSITMEAGKSYLCRYEVTFLLSDNLAA